MYLWLMRYLAFFAVLLAGTSCLVPKKELLFSQEQVVRLQSDSIALEQRLLAAQDTAGSTQGQLEELRKGYDELWSNLANCESVLQTVTRELDSLQLRHKEVGVERDVWRVEAIRARRRMERAEYLRDSLQAVMLELKPAPAKPKK